MGAVFALGFGFVVVFIGVMIAVLGIGGEALFAALMVRGKRFGKPLLVVSAVVTRIGALVALTPIVFFGLIIGSNFVLPSNFVMTEIAMEFPDETWESPTAYDSFTANDVTYVRLEDLYCNSETTYKTRTPVFHYIPDAAIMRHIDSFNGYSIPNSSGYELIEAAYYLYCRTEDCDAILDYYSNESPRTYYLDTRYGAFGDYDGEYFRLPPDIESTIVEIFSLDQETLELKEITLYNEYPDCVNIDVVSEDGAIFYDSLWIDYYNGYFCFVEYSTPDLDKDIDVNAKIYGLRLLPEDINEILVSYFWGV